MERNEISALPGTDWLSGRNRGLSMFVVTGRDAYARR